jgi:hypothetical protein
MRFLGGVLVVILVVAAFALLVVGGTELGYRLDKHYQPLEEQVRHDTFANSQTFTEGMARDLSNLRLQYNATGETDAQKEIIRDTVRERYGSYDPNKLPSDLLPFFNQMMTN